MQKICNTSLRHETIMHIFKPIKALHQRSGLTNQSPIAAEQGLLQVCMAKWESKASYRDRQSRKQLDSSEVSTNQKEPFQLSGKKMSLQFQYYNPESLKYVPDSPVANCYYRTSHHFLSQFPSQKSSQNKSYESLVS